MTAPAKRENARVSALPAPKLISLVDSPTGPSDHLTEPWWAEYGGTLDVASGVVSFPPRSLPPCPFPCERCAQREGAQ